MKEFELDSYERSIVQAGREAPGPSDVQRTRVRKAIGARLAAGAVLAFSMGTPLIATAFKIGAVAIVGGSLAVGTYFVAAPDSRVKPSHEQARSSLNPPVVAPSNVPYVEPEQEPTPVQRETRPRLARSIPVVPARTPPADLGSELSLLGQTKAAIEGGDLRRAAELLRTYDKRFHHGLMAEERMATGVLYLCATGRTDEAKSKARQFARRYPRSPLLIRIEGTCAGKVTSSR